MSDPMITDKLAEIRDEMKHLLGRLKRLDDAIRHLNDTLYENHEFDKLDEGLLKEISGLLEDGKGMFPIVVESPLMQVIKSHFLVKANGVLREHGFKHFRHCENCETSGLYVETMKRYRCNDLEIKLYINVVVPNQTSERVKYHGAYTVSGFNAGSFESPTIESEDIEFLCKELESNASRVASLWPLNEKKQRSRTDEQKHTGEIAEKAENDAEKGE